MSVVYHGVPRDMVGDVIYPLNELSSIQPRLYEEQRSKYAGRESVLDFRIPGLGLLFNDAVHCGSVHPYHLFSARRAVGIEVAARPQPPALATGLFFEIPVERILVHPVVWYSGKTLWSNGAPNEDVPLTPPPDEFEPFDPERYREFPDVTPQHLSYLKRMKERGERALMFVHIPHILVAGAIDVSGARVVPWDEPP
jgi:hypothetical protein